MLSYATVGSNDLARAEAFYTPLLGMLGISKMFDHPRGGVMFGKDGKFVLGVLKPFDGQPATSGNGAMIAFDMADHAAVDAFHAKALTLGAVDEGAPGERGPGYYFSYFRDPDGNKLSAFKLG